MILASATENVPTIFFMPSQLLEVQSVALVYMYIHVHLIRFSVLLFLLSYGSLFVIRRHWCLTNKSDLFSVLQV